ncbi:Electrogenic sodium bicarbonate cotransporter 1 [Labeo rohita]|uniref:Anion exchange protein n=1 Tax=Labeo rohita TaxID=84645 RepID=A0ABQ8LLN6_LABRO|nr:Electrogenic sodium bicarbonate cotransporter 1 [Labeo rohita]
MRCQKSDCQMLIQHLCAYGSPASSRMEDEAVVDRGASYIKNVCDEEVEGHHTVYIGVHVPKSYRRRRRHRRRSNHKERRERLTENVSDKSDTEAADDPSSSILKPLISPAAERIRFILGEDDSGPPPPQLFTELDELLAVDGQEMEWKETARWIKFEEKVEKGGERWSKPHVATLSLHSLFQLKNCIEKGTIKLDMEANSLQQIIESGQLKADLKEMVMYTLLRKHRHQTKKSNLRSLADIGKSVSSASRLFSSQENGSPTTAHRNLTSNSLNDLSDKPEKDQLNNKFMKKIPRDAEASNVLVGEVDFLDTPFVAFVFHDIAYKAKDRGDLLAGIDEFLDEVIVLPPGEWDPDIRIEPPKSVPSADKRKNNIAGGEGLQMNGGTPHDGSSGGGGGHAAGEELKFTGKFCGGLILDVKRKLPFYASDFYDALHIQSLSAILFIYLGTVTNAITFGGLLGDATENMQGVLESFLGTALTGAVFCMFAGQPLTILSSTGPVLVFERLLFNFSKDNNFDYLEFRLWIGLWSAFLCLVLVATDASFLVQYFTRFTEEGFSALISFIFIYDSFKKMLKLAHHHPINSDFNMDLVTQYGCHCAPPDGNISAVYMEKMEALMNSTGQHLNATWASLTRSECLEWGGQLEGPACSYVPDITLMSFILFFGTYTCSMGLKKFKTSRFFPTRVRKLISDFAIILAILIFCGVDALVGVDTPKLIVPSEFKPTSPHRGWFVPPFGGNPWWVYLASFLPALLVTILIFMDQQITAVIVNRKEHKLKMETETSAPGEQPKFLGVREQRVTGTMVFILTGLSVLMAPVLKFIPMPVLYGVFLYMGVASLNGVQFMDRLQLLLMPAKHQPDLIYLRHVPLRRVHLFTFIQVLCLALLWVLKSTVAAIIFPVMILALVAVRKAMDYVFSQHDLGYLDDVMPEKDKKKKEDEKKKKKKKGSIDSDMNDSDFPAIETVPSIKISMETMEQEPDLNPFKKMVPQIRIDLDPDNNKFFWKTPASETSL